MKVFSSPAVFSPAVFSAFAAISAISGRLELNLWPIYAANTHESR